MNDSKDFSSGFHSWYLLVIPSKPDVASDASMSKRALSRPGTSTVDQTRNVLQHDLLIRHRTKRDRHVVVVFRQRGEESITSLPHE